MTTEQQDTEQQDTEQPQATEKPEVTDEAKEKAKEMMKAYDDDRPTISMPGTNGAVSGTAVNDWLDDDGDPKYSDTEKDEG